MSEVLDQAEVDALLEAVNQDPPADDTEPVHVFASGQVRSSDQVEIRPYDFKRPERVSKEQMRALEHLHDGFSRNFGAALSGYLRTIVEVKVTSIGQMTFSEFTHDLPNPTCFNLLGCAPLDGKMCLQISPMVIYPIIDRLLGGTNTELFIPQRPLTAIELRLAQTIIDRATHCLDEAWSVVTPAKFDLQETEHNPQLVQIVPPNEVVVVVGFEFKMGTRNGPMSLCIPYNVIEPVMEKLSKQTWAAYRRSGRDELLRRRMVQQLESAKLTGSCVLAQTTITLTELINLRAGDIILTEKPASAPLTLLIEGRRKHIGHLGKHRGNRAFKVQRVYVPKDRV